MIEIAFLVEIDVTAPDGLTSERLYFADTAIAPFKPGDADRPNRAYDPRVKDAGNVVRGLDLENLDGELGGGVIVISNNDGALTPYRSHRFGRYAIYRGFVGQAFGDYELLLSGRCGTPEFGRSSSRPDQLLVPVFDPRADLEKAVQETLYAGTNTGGGSGYEGTADGLKDRPKPKALGNLTKANVPAIWANAEDLVAQVDDGPYEAIVTIYNGGGNANLTSLGNLTGAAFDAAAPGATEYVEDRTRGLVKFGVRLEGAVTFDLKGSTQGMYFEDAPGLIHRVLENAGITNISPNVLGTNAPEPVGLWLGDTVSVGAVIGFLARSIGAVVLPDRAGMWRLTEIAPPAATPLLTLEADDLVAVHSVADPLSTPTWRVSVNYARNYQVMSGAALQGSVMGTEREEYLAHEWRTAIADDVTIKDRWPGAIERFIDTGLLYEADAAALGARLLALYGPRTDGSAREVLEIQIPMTSARLALEPGQTVRLEDGVDRNFIVTRIEPTRPHRHLMTLELFG